jgi:hydrogenase maturation protease
MAFHDWLATVHEVFDNGRGMVHLVGVGNPIKGDDALGLEVVSALRARLGASPTRRIRIHPQSLSPERILPKLAESGTVVIFDAVEANRAPGAIVCSKLSDTKFGFFATHNLPLRIVPGISGREAQIYVVGIQPESVDIGEGLTPTAKASVDKVVEGVVDAVEATR